MYSVLLILLATIVVMHVEILYRKKKLFSHGAVLRLSSCGSALGKDKKQKKRRKKKEEENTPTLHLGI